MNFVDPKKIFSFCTSFCTEFFAVTCKWRCQYWAPGWGSVFAGGFSGGEHPPDFTKLRGITERKACQRWHGRAAKRQKRHVYAEGLSHSHPPKQILLSGLAQTT